MCASETDAKTEGPVAHALFVDLRGHPVLTNVVSDSGGFPSFQSHTVPREVIFGNVSTTSCKFRRIRHLESQLGHQVLQGAAAVSGQRQWTAVVLSVVVAG